jgi:alcohol dehydrogenase YqhD (iron-dependent ADH family)
MAKIIKTRPFRITVYGESDMGSHIVDVFVYAVNKERLFDQLKNTIMHNKIVEITDVEKDILYTKEEFLFCVTRSDLVVNGLEYAEMEELNLDHTISDCQIRTKKLLKEYKRRVKIN